MGTQYCPVFQSAPPKGPVLTGLPEHPAMAAARAATTATLAPQVTHLLCDT